MPQTKVNDIAIYYKIHDEGSPLLIVWGIGGEIPPLVDLLVKSAGEKYQVIVFDNRGSGRTDKPDMPYSIKMMAHDTNGLMDAIGITCAHFLGISTGSRFALTLAARYPDRVLSLVLNVAAARSPEKEDPEAFASFERLRMAMTQPGFAEKMLSHPPTVASFIQYFWIWDSA